MRPLCSPSHARSPQPTFLGIKDHRAFWLHLQHRHPVTQVFGREPRFPWLHRLQAGSILHNRPGAGSTMIPDCNDDGYLPAGIHPATLDEIATRFGRESELRQAQMESLRWLVDLARRAGVRRIVVNGSFVTDKLEPNDVDCVLLIGPEFTHDRAA